MKISIIYYCDSGNTKRIAELITEGANRSVVIEAKAMNIEAINHPFLLESKAIIIGSPEKNGTISWQMKKWLETKYTKGQLKGKLGGVFSTSEYFGAGAEHTQIELIKQLLFKGLLVYSSGTAEKQPFTHLGIAAIKDGIDYQEEKARVFGERIAKKTVELFLYK